MTGVDAFGVSAVSRAVVCGAAVTEGAGVVGFFLVGCWFEAEGNVAAGAAGEGDGCGTTKIALQAGHRNRLPTAFSCTEALAPHCEHVTTNAIVTPRM